MVVPAIEVVDEARTEGGELAVGAPTPVDDEELVKPTGADLEEPTVEELGVPAAEELEVLPTDEPGMDGPVRMYLRKIGSVALLTAQDEVVLAKAIELGEAFACVALDASDVASGDRPRQRGEVQERSAGRLHRRRGYPIDHTCAPRTDSLATPARLVHFEHEFTRGEVSERPIEAVLKHAPLT